MNPQIIRRRNFLREQSRRLTIGFTGIADFRSFIGQEYTAGIQKAAVDYDLNFINMAEAVKYSLFDDINIMAHYRKKFQFMRAPLVDGLVTWASSLADYLPPEQIVAQFSALKPLPMVDIGYLAIPGVPSLRIDNTFSMHLLIEHLTRVHGYQTFAFVGCKASRPHLERRDSFVQEVRAAGLLVSDGQIFMADSLETVAIVAQVDALCKRFFSAANAASAQGTETKRIDAIVTSSDIIAATLIAELEKRGIHVPGDVAVTGFNNQYNGITALSPVTTIDLAYFKRGYEAVEQLIDGIMQGAPTEHRVVPTRLLVRESCGCFEHSVIAAGNRYLAHDAPLTTHSSEEQARAFLFAHVNNIFAEEPLESKRALIDAVFCDIYNAVPAKNAAQSAVPPQLLEWARRLFRRTKQGTNAPDYQNKLTELRRVVLYIVHDNDAQYRHIEDIFNQLRVLFSLSHEYDIIANHEGAAFFNNITHLALSFASATTGKQIQNILRYQLSTVEIPGIVLALSDNMTKDLEECAVNLVIPEPPEDIAKSMPYKVRTPANVPRRFFPAEQRFSFMLEILQYSDRYFGYAFLQMGSQNIALYDSVRQLLSQALYGVYLREGRTRDHAAMLSTQRLASILHVPASPHQEENRSQLSTERILNYLVEHIGEMTDLNAMSDVFNVSKTHLVRQTKKLTGYTVQTLHEKLKIEQAKDLLMVQGIRLADISARLGFMNPNYFSNVFKKNTGVSPREWARRNKP